ncbi:MetQ/NlpA family ABC transporter substrate-binding protein [Phaeovibrio sulfidiphilus]|uniref:Lipoprotein n=1 Tax=Phaeovibrio sulfidiphilus TaxID=1220600 RepID=A0A8J6Z165_9PROT|nr:MetQ/NlpA family ABC transporter substrate-binding protein [Phaeovibrio sulfidiphilus]MBE1237853.1 MetQ/NlpA family ABC transporter substrate-binding protein [Phaeovibrio sulfidiphilus]
MKRRLFALPGLALALLLGFGASAQAKDTIVVGVTPFPHRAIMEKAAPLLKAKGYDLVIRDFSDYVQPNIALAEGSLDANFHQHIPYLDTTKVQRGLDLTWVAKVHIEPLGLYSKKIQNISELKKGDIISLPNDPSNGSRALRLLAAHGLITLKDKDLVTVRDVVDNPLGLKLVELDAAQLPRTLVDVTASVINTNFAVQGGLIPIRDALLIEDADSPYVNVVVVRTSDRDQPWVRALVEAVNSPEVRAFIVDDLASRGIVPAFDVPAAEPAAK